jgi:hypothetical protein
MSEELKAYCEDEDSLFITCFKYFNIFSGNLFFVILSHFKIENILKTKKKFEIF